MKRLKIIGLFVAIAIGTSVSAQNTSFEDVLGAVEQNNTTLKALRSEMEAQALQNKTGISLPDPEVEFSYLWGSPSGIPNRKDISVRQRFDMSTVLGYRRRVANGENDLLDLQYKQDRIALLLETKFTLVDLIYTNAMRKELIERYRQAKSLSDAYLKREQQGSANVIEINKVALNLSIAEGALNRIEIERQSLLQNLQRLNGGVAIEFDNVQYNDELSAADFQQWYTQAEQRNPLLGYIQKEIEVNHERVRLSKSMNLPNISLGYGSELIPQNNYRGVTVGISIPLWSNKNRVKQSRAAVRASENKMVDAKQQFYSSLVIQYDKTIGFMKIAEEYSVALSKLNNADLLVKALDAGQISLLDYVVEIGFYYDAITQMLQAQRDYQTALAELQAVWL